MRRGRSRAGTGARLTGALLLALAMVAAAGLASRAGGAARLPILGFQAEGDPPSAITRSAGGLASVGVDGLLLTGPGEVSRVDSAELRQLARAHRQHLPAQLLVSNYSNRINDFSERLARATLANPAAIAALVSRLRTEVLSGGWSGVILDIESLQRRDARGLVQLASSLRAALPANLGVGVTLGNSTTAAGFVQTGFDLGGLAASGAQLILMAYDQHGTWERTPGPVGALSWARAGLRVLLGRVPGSHVVLGVAGYGYAWRPHGVTYVSDAQARRLAGQPGAHAQWVRSVGEWRARLRDGSTVWWSDARSLGVRERLAATLHLAGLAVWSLGLSDPIRG